MSTAPSQLRCEPKVDSAYYEVLPDLSQLLHDYEIDQVLEIRLICFSDTRSPDELTCCFHDGAVVCGLKECNGDSGSIELPPEQKQPFCEKIALILRGIFQTLKEVMERNEWASEIKFFVAQGFSAQNFVAQSDDDFKPCCVIRFLGFCCAPNRELLCQRCNCC